MKRIGFLLSLVAMLGVLASSLPAAAKKAAAPKKKAAAKKKPAAKAAAKAAGEISLATMKQEVPDLSAAQLEKLEKLWAARDKALADWDAAPQGARLAKLQEGAQLGASSSRAEIGLLLAARDGVRQTHDAKILAVLTPAQQAKWTGFLLYKYLSEKLSEKGAALTPGQATEARSLCDRAARARPGAGVMQLRGPVFEAIFERVLTDQQRKAVNPNYKAKSDKKKNNNRNNNKNNKNKNKNNNPLNLGGINQGRGGLKL